MRSNTSETGLRRIALTSNPRSLDDYRNELRSALSNKRYFAYAGLLMLKMSEFLDPADYAAILADVQMDEVKYSICRLAFLRMIQQDLNEK